MLALVIWLAAWLVIALIAMAFLIAITQLKLKGSLRWEPGPKLQVEVSALNGTLPYLIIMDGARKRSKKPKRRSKRASHRLGHVKNMVGNLPTLIHNLRNRIHIEDVSGRLEFGFDDPADTGQVFGLLSPLIYGMSPLGRMSLSIHPIFSRPTFAGNIEVLMKFTPIALIGPITSFAWRSFRTR